MRARLWSLVLMAAFVAACSEDSPNEPSSQQAGIVAGNVVPANGGSVTATGQVPGAFVLPGSGAIAVPLTLTARNDLPFAEVMVLLQDANGVECAANLPDRPTWAPFRASRFASVTVTGFQVWRLPCPVSRIRVYMHTRNDPHLLTPPPADLTVAEATIPANFTIR
jgi:hypothetical protein